MMGKLLILCMVMMEMLISPLTASQVSDVGVGAHVGDFPASTEPPEYLRNEIAEGPSPSTSMTMMMLKHRSAYHDKSEIGGGVIIAGLISSCLAVLYFYIRATRRRNSTAFIDDLLK
ncbi:hypothetical protein Dimus_037557 [Dionaea muscipula]